MATKPTAPSKSSGKKEIMSNLYDDPLLISREKYLKDHPELYPLLSFFESEIVRAKPLCIEEFANNFFAPDNRSNIESALGISLQFR
jgi:hypothetical protein